MAFVPGIAIGYRPFPALGELFETSSWSGSRQPYIDNAKLDYRLLDQYKRAECALRVWIVNTTSAPEAMVISGILNNKTRFHPVPFDSQCQPGSFHICGELPRKRGVPYGRLTLQICTTST